MNKNKKVNNNKMNKIKNQPIKQNEQKTPKMTKNETAVSFRDIN